MEVKIKRSLENIPLSIFYTLVLVGLIFFFDYVEAPILIAISSIVMTYLVLSTTYGRAVVSLPNDRIYLYSGVFSIGKKISINVKDLKSVYVKKTIHGNEDSGQSFRLSIIFNSGQKIKFLTNRIGEDKLMEYRNRIVDAILKRYDKDSLPNWNEYQHEYFREDFD